MNRSVILYPALTLLLIAGVGVGAAADDTDELVAHARAAAPASISDHATIVVGGKVVVEGNNGWTCMPNTMPNDTAPVCVDAVWGEMMQAMGAKAPYKATKVGISYMLLGDSEGNGASNSDPFHPDPPSADDYVETGPHLMIIVPKEQLEGMTDDPSTGGPYVMWGNTDYAHIMVPVADKK